MACGSSEVITQRYFRDHIFDQYLPTRYGDQLSVKRGQLHDYLGMEMDYSTKGEVKIGMIKYLKKVEDKYPKPIIGTEKSPDGKHLFQVRKDTDPQKRYLEETKAVKFHHVVAQLLFVSSRARHGIHTTISLLTSRVRKPDEDDWGKLVRCMKYLKGTNYMQITLTVDTMSVIKWWVDATHHTHMDCRGHTGDMMSIGKGAAVSYYGKHNINKKKDRQNQILLVLMKCL